MGAGDGEGRLLLLLLLLSQSADSNTISCDNQEGAAQNGRSAALAPRADTGFCIHRGLFSFSTSNPALGPTTAVPKCQRAVGKDQSNAHQALMTLKLMAKQFCHFLKKNIEMINQRSILRESNNLALYAPLTLPKVVRASTSNQL